MIIKLFLTFFLLFVFNATSNAVSSSPQPIFAVNSNLPADGFVIVGGNFIVKNKDNRLGFCHLTSEENNCSYGTAQEYLEKLFQTKNIKYVSMGVLYKTYRSFDVVLYYSIPD